MKQKKNGFFITILLLLISLAFIVTVSVVFNNIKTNLEREITISSVQVLTKSVRKLKRMQL